MDKENTEKITSAACFNIISVFRILSTHESNTRASHTIYISRRSEQKHSMYISTHTRSNMFFFFFCQGNLPFSPRSTFYYIIFDAFIVLFCFCIIRGNYHYLTSTRKRLILIFITCIHTYNARQLFII